jgi:hypothetical protein
MYDYTVMACKLHDRAVSRNYRLILLFLFGVNHIWLFLLWVCPKCFKTKGGGAGQTPLVITPSTQQEREKKRFSRVIDGRTVERTDGRGQTRESESLRPCKCAITTPPVCVAVVVCMCFFSSTYTVTKPVALSGSLRVRDHSLVLHTWASRGRRRNAVCLIRLFHMDVHLCS